MHTIERAAVYLDLTSLSHTMLLYKKAENSRPWQFMLLTCFPHWSLKLEKYKELKDNSKKCSQILCTTSFEFWRKSDCFTFKQKPVTTQHNVNKLYRSLLFQAPLPPHSFHFMTHCMFQLLPRHTVLLYVLITLNVLKNSLLLISWQFQFMKGP